MALPAQAPDGQADEQMAVFPAEELRSPSLALGMRWIPQAIQSLRDGGGFRHCLGLGDRGGGPGRAGLSRARTGKPNVGEPARIVEAAAADAGDELGELFDEPHARGTVHAFEQELERALRPGLGRIQREKRWIVELGVVTARRERGAG